MSSNGSSIGCSDGSSMQVPLQTVKRKRKRGLRPWLAMPAHKIAVIAIDKFTVVAAPATVAIAVFVAAVAPLRLLRLRVRLSAAL